MTRRFLFLQGPPGPFFSDVSNGLRAEGHICHRINLNGGDHHDWPHPAFHFRDRADAWPDFLDTILTDHGITDIVLFGDCRPMHREACRLAAARAICVHVFEEGYVRPDWVTLERGGVNGYSLLPRDPKHYLQVAADLAALPTRSPLPASFRRRAVEAVAYFFASWLRTLLYPGYRSHRPYPLALEAAGWTRRLALAPVARWRSKRSLRRLGRTRYFVLPLQLDSDHQIRTHSPFTSMRDAIGVILESFAAHAPAQDKLVVKMHPLDNGLRPWRRIVLAAASRSGLMGRVIFLEDGDLERLVTAAAGVVTVNSTSGTLALAVGRPVKVLGTAVYDIPGITHQGSLDDFWSEPGWPQTEIFNAFVRVLVARCLLHGGFNSPAGRAMLVPHAVARLGRPVRQAEDGVHSTAASA